MSRGLRGNAMSDRSVGFLDGHGRGESDEPNTFRVDERDREAMVDFLDAEERILACQYHTRSAIESPALRLAWACLLLSIADMFPPVRTRWKNETLGRFVAGVDAENQADAIQWMKSEDTSHIYAFNSLADLFGFSPEGLRAKLLARIETGQRPKLPRGGESFPSKAKRIVAKKAA